jgi:hypothetical protein
MTRRYDLHCHSTVSDGTLAPAAVVTLACAQGVDVLALTDHDTTDGIVEARAAAESNGLTLITGAEVSVDWHGQTLHVLGLNMDEQEQTLAAGLARQQRARRERAARIGARLAAHGIEGAGEGAQLMAGAGSVGRTHFARHLVAKGHARDVNDAFRRYLRRGKPGHVAVEWAALPEAIGWIRAAGGVAVLAHPARYEMTATRLRLLLGEFKDCGGVGIEVASGNQRPDALHHHAELARRFGLLASCGSDYHGPEQTWLALGRLPPLPAGLTPVWQAWE